jgi:hypothetical protein
MSVELPRDVSVATDDVEIPDTPGDVFETLLANASLCCQQCYRRLRARRRFPADAGYRYADLLSFVDAELPDGADWELLGTEYYTTDGVDERLERMHPPGEDTSRTGCAVCGAVEPHRSPSTRSRSEALQAAVGIAASLQEWGVAHNPLALLVEVADCKRDSDMAGDDFGTFARATERAIRAGRSR